LIILKNISRRSIEKKENKHLWVLLSSVRKVNKIKNAAYLSGFFIFVKRI